MILIEKLEIIVKNNLRKYYADLGYIFPSTWDPKIIIDIKDLPKSSNIKIDCVCDICGKINNISYYHYNKNIKIGGFYSCKGKCSRVKFKSTCLEKFGFENSFQNEEIKQKSKNTIMEKFGVDNISKLYSIKDKKIQRNLKKYGVSNYFNNDDFKEKSSATIKTKYNCDGNVFQCDTIKNKIKETYRKKYNVDFPSQCVDIHKKQQISGFNLKKYNDSNIYYRGTYELDFLEKYYDKINIKNGMTIRYEDNKIYFPDFYIPELNMIIEIKSIYTYNKYLIKNLQKQKACLEQGYNFIFIIDKNYDKFQSSL